METPDPAAKPMRPRLPLYAQVLLWFFVNLAVVALALALLLRAQLNPGLESLLSARAGERVGALGRAVAGELRNAKRETWNEILARFGEAYGVTLMLCGPAGEWIAGPFDPPPPKVMNHLRHTLPPGRRPGPEGPAPDRPADDRPRFPHPPAALNPPPFSDPAPLPHPEFRGPGARPLFFTRDGSPPRYWAGVQVSLATMASRHPPGGVLLVVSQNLAGGGLFLDPLPWILGVGGVVLLSALIWAPFVRHVTRRLHQMTFAAERISQGRFDIAIPAGGADELARLADSINRMASRLGHLVNGQRRFLGDIAHELCSPLARARIALGVLAQGSRGDAAARVCDVEEELEQLSDLVHELLSFSKASLGARAAPAVRVPLLPLVEEVIRREARDCDTRIDVPDGFAVIANREMLGRALANVVRNAARYAAEHGPLTIRADRHGSAALLRVLDEGPGIPPDMLERVFEPFFRPEEARTRETGGTGLGLAIARTCLGAFGASIHCANRQPRGLEVVIQLDGSPPEET